MEIRSKELTHLIKFISSGYIFQFAQKYYDNGKQKLITLFSWESIVIAFVFVP